ncbi:J domain-containing protein [Phenylobacterium sp.]|jgi:hypothetical protein|uniref:J domain-containing protein n=1 Tax=Phenylobacterium sp. TaxID=1871053 RepID=UPI002F3F92F4
MIYLALGCAALALLAWAGGRPVFKRRGWRLVSAAAALAAFTGAAYAGVRGAWEPAVVLIVAGLWLGFTTRTAGAGRPAPERPQAEAAGRMSLAQARSILGVGADASASEIQTAYARLMRLAHPDKGGTDGLAAQLNAARDRLLKG